MDRSHVWVLADERDLFSRSTERPLVTNETQQNLCALECVDATQEDESTYVPFRPIAACAVGQVRGFSLRKVYLTSYRRLIAPIRRSVDVFFALDSSSAGNYGVLKYPNRSRSLPVHLMQLFRPVSVQWGRAGRLCCSLLCEEGCPREIPQVDRRCANTYAARTLVFGQQFNLWRASNMIVQYEREERQGVRYSWVLLEGAAFPTRQCVQQAPSAL